MGSDDSTRPWRRVTNLTRFQGEWFGAMLHGAADLLDTDGSQPGPALDTRPCAECGRDVFYDDRAGDYRHDDHQAPACALALAGYTRAEQDDQEAAYEAASLADDVMPCGCCSGSCYCDGDTPTTGGRLIDPKAPLRFLAHVHGGALVCSGSVDCYAVGYADLAGWVVLDEADPDRGLLCPQCAADCLVAPIRPASSDAGTDRLARDIAWMGRLQKGAE